jgi:transcription elongation factor GreA
MDTIPISTEGFNKLKQELDDLKRERPEVIQAIKEAREEGDLRENAGYDAARERQGMLEARISHIESRLPRCDVVDIHSMDGEKIAFGATVEIEDIDTEERKRFTLLGPDEADFKKGSISVYSPLAQALLGKEAGDEAVVYAPRGRIDYEIISVEYKGFPEGHFNT